MKLHDSEYLTLYYYKKRSLIKDVWKEMSVDLNKEKMKDELLIRFSFVQKYKPKYLLSNAKFFFFKIPPELQQWINHEIRSKYEELGIEKLGFVISDDLIAQISIEQSLQENENPPYRIKYFDTEEEAKKWIFDEYDS